MALAASSRKITFEVSRPQFFKFPDGLNVAGLAADICSRLCFEAGASDVAGRSVVSGNDIHRLE